MSHRRESRDDDRRTVTGELLSPEDFVPSPKKEVVLCRRRGRRLKAITQSTPKMTRAKELNEKRGATSVLRMNPQVDAMQLETRHAIVRPSSSPPKKKKKETHLSRCRRLKNDRRTVRLHIRKQQKVDENCRLVARCSRKQGHLEWQTIARQGHADVRTRGHRRRRDGQNHRSTRINREERGGRSRNRNENAQRRKPQSKSR
ncbi:hypothetical protein H6P81_016276 [Aristolochia fimbriata]|uniref:Uncharacterized protein n=1 Tax=Aristolochia fimbriata TaxID=158543 RepID=A0AAV7E950_ARIFI|nr:hypothetical protein H6P81_016276 [Aristolochia fimbriata]